MPVSKNSPPAGPLEENPQPNGIPGFPAPYWSAPRAALYLGDVRACLRAMPARGVHCCVTSPPYWGLRDYGTGKWEGGDAECGHIAPPTGGMVKGSTLVGSGNRDGFSGDGQYRGRCRKCGARRTDMQIGAEPSPDCGTHGQAQCGGCFVCALVGVFREVYRVLRDDGTVWCVLGDTYSSGSGGDGTTSAKQQSNRGTQINPRAPLKEMSSGNLVGVPWRVALALQADGWVLRQDIIWYSPNKMPESVTNRCTKSHEHIFLLAKGPDYYYDAVAIEEDSKGGAAPRLRANGERVDETKAKGGKQQAGNRATVNKRDVWTVPTTGYHGAHFAAYSPRLITPCILAGTSEYGCCARCGRPYERVVVRERADSRMSGGGNCFGKQLDGVIEAGAQQEDNYRQVVGSETVGWRRACGCRTDAVSPAVVLDPFVGSGTTVATALQLGRAGVGVDLSEEYLLENAVPRIEAALAGVGIGRRPRAARAVLPDSPPLPRRMRDG